MSLYFVRLQDAKESEGSVLHINNIKILNNIFSFIEVNKL